MRKMTIKCIACGEKGGKFRFTPRGYVHAPQCGAIDKLRDAAKSTFPFTAQHLRSPNDGPVEVQSMRHLRQLENHYGCQSEVYNQNSQNIAPHEG